MIQLLLLNCANLLGAGGQPVKGSPYAADRRRGAYGGGGGYYRSRGGGGGGRGGYSSRSRGGDRDQSKGSSVKG